MDPFICFAKCFSSWAAIKVLMGFALAFCIIDMGISAWGSTSSGGGFSNLSINGTQPYHNWEASVCEATPYLYLRPFSFTYTLPDGSSENFPTYCSFPTSNSEFRLAVTTFAIVTLFILFFHTPLSFLARPIFITYGLLFFAATVLDMNSTVTGVYTCNHNFANTQLNVDITEAGYVLYCTSDPYIALCAIDFLLFFLFVLLYTAWLFCKDKYVRKANQPTSDEKSLVNNPEV